MAQPKGSTILDFEGTISKHVSAFTGRQELLDRVEQWADAPKAKQHCVVKGGPGTGKSALASVLARQLPAHATHFCNARNIPTIEPQTFVQHIAYRLSSLDAFALQICQDAEIHVKIEQEIRANYGQAIGIYIKELVIGATTYETAFVEAFIKPLNNMYQHGYASRVLLVVDALDEAAQYSGQLSIVDLLTRAGELPAQVRLLLTTRPASSVLSTLEDWQVSHEVVELPAPDTRDDIANFVTDRLERDENLMCKVVASGVTPEQFTENIAELSKGNYLFVEQLLKSIAWGEVDPGDPASFPTELDDVYRIFMRSRIKARSKSWQDRLRPILGPVSVAKAPLIRSQLRRLSGLDQQEFSETLDEIREFLDTAEWQVERYSAFHESFRDFLVQRDRAKEFWIEPTVQHRRFIDFYEQAGNWSIHNNYGLRYLSQHLLTRYEQLKEADLGG